MKYVYFHIGPPKTGSTSIQKALKENLKNINKFYIPKAGVTTTDIINHANIAFHLLGDSRFNKGFGNLDDLLNEIKKINYNVLISSEDLFFVLMDKKKKNLLENKIKECGFKIKYICFLRNDFNYFYSISNEFIRHKYKEIKKTYINHSLYYIRFFLSVLFYGSFSINVHGIKKRFFIDNHKMKKLIQEESSSEFHFIKYSKSNLVKFFFDFISEKNIKFTNLNINVSQKKKFKVLFSINFKSFYIFAI